MAIPEGRSASLLDEQSLSISIGIGYERGTANEYVYNPDGSKLSQLIWKYDNIPVLKGQLDWNAAPGLRFSASTAINLGQSSTMDDWDWGDDTCPDYICHSHHNDTRLRQQTSFDLSVSKELADFNPIKFSVLAGYRFDYSKWEAWGGWANYDPEPFPNTLVIRYEQWWQTPYIGVHLQADHGKWHYQGQLAGSWWVQSHDRDDHRLTTTLFLEQFHPTEMIAVSSEIGYQIEKSISLNLSYEYRRYGTGKGVTKWHDYSLGEYGGGDGYDDAGANNITQNIGLSVRYHF